MPPLDFSGSGTLVDAPDDKREKTIAPDFSKFGKLVSSDEEPERPSRLSRIAKAYGETTMGALTAPVTIGATIGRAIPQAAKAQAEDISTGYEDKPGYHYGNVLPFRENEKTGEIEWGYSPESARSLIRAARHTLDFDITNPQHRSDVTAVAMAMLGLHRPPTFVPGGAAPPPAPRPRTEPGFTPPGATEEPVQWGVRAPQLTGPPPEPAAPPGQARVPATAPPASAAPPGPEPQPQPQLPGPVATAGSPVPVVAPSPEPPATATEPWTPVADAPAEQPLAETPIAAAGANLPPEATPSQDVPGTAQERPQATPEQIPASDLKPGDTVIVGGEPHVVEAVRPWTGDQIGVKLKDDPQLHIGSPDAPVERLPTVVPETPETAAPAPIEAHGGPWSPLLGEDGKPATNAQNQPLYENANGVRALMEGSVPYTERTKDDPEKGMVPHDVVSRRGQFLTAEEAGRAASPKPTTPPATKARLPSQSKTGPGRPDLSMRSPSEEEQVKLAETQTPAQAEPPGKRGGISESAPAGQSPVSTDLPAASPPASTPAEKPGSSTGLSEIGEAAKAIGENLRAMLWERVQAGRTDSAGGPDNLLTLAKTVKDAGGLQDRSAFDEFVSKIAPLLGDRTEGWQNRLREAGREFIPPPAEKPSTEGAKPEAAIPAPAAPAEAPKAEEPTDKIGPKPIRTIAEIQSQEKVSAKRAKEIQDGEILARGKPIPANRRLPKAPG